MKNFVDQNTFGIIGIGRFGYALADVLLTSGKHVIAIDKDSAPLMKLKDRTRDIHVISVINQDTIRETGLGACSTAIICIGQDVESNLLATINILELGVPRVISKAINDDHGLILKKLGAEVIYPEVDMGVRLGKSLTTKNTLDFLAVNEDFAIVELELSSYFDGKTLIDLDFRNTYGLNVIALIKEGKAQGDILPTTILHVGDVVVVAGANEKLQSFQDINAKHA